MHIREESQPLTMTNKAQHPFIVRPVTQNAQRHQVNLSSLDELIRSQIDEEEIDIVSQDPHKAKKIDIRTDNKSLVGYAIIKQEGQLKRNVKNDKRFHKSIDNMITSGQDKKVIIENSIFAPMKTSKNTMAGLIQIANCDKQLPFTE